MTEIKLNTMGLTKYKLGELIELSDERNTEGLYGIEDVRGISNSKEIMPTKADVDNNVIKKFYIVRPGQFIYNPRTTRMGDKVGLAYNDQNKPLLFSFNNIAFAIKESAQNIILPQYLYIYFNRSEFDRYAITNSWGSATELFSFDEMCDIDITLPDIDQQRKFVNVYLSLQNNLAAYQSKVDELKMVCDGYIEELRRNMKCEKIGSYITESTIKNSDNKIKEVRSISVTKEFKLTNAKVNKEELSGYLVVNPKEIAFVQTTGNEKVLAFAYNDFGFPIVVSSVDKVFRTNDENVLDLQYLALFLSRKEFDRYARFNSWGSAREVFTMEDMNEVEIPIPNISIQHEIVNIYRCYIERQRIAALLKEQLNEICPILIKGSLQEK